MGPFEILAMAALGSFFGTVIAVMLINQFKFDIEIDDMLEESE